MNFILFFIIMKYIIEEEQDFIAWDNVVSIQLVKDLCKLLFCFWFICIVILLYFRCWPWKPIFIVYSIQHTVKPQVWYVASFSICHENITITTKTCNTLYIYTHRFLTISYLIIYTIFRNYLISIINLSLLQVHFMSMFIFLTTK
jgi:hypothetical protein